MSPHLIVRPAQRADHAQLITVKPYWGDDRTPTEDVALRFQQMAADNLVYLIVEIGGQIIGHVLLKFTGELTEPGCAAIEDLYVREAYRRLGAATALMRHCEVIAHEHGYTALALATGVDANGAARHLYRKLGYVVVNDEPYVDGVYQGEKDWVIDMKKMLAE